MGVCQLRHLSGREFKYQFRFHKVLFRIYTNYTDITQESSPNGGAIHVLQFSNCDPSDHLLDEPN